MKFIRFFLISFVALSLVVSVISLFFPSHVRISRAVNLSAGSDSVLLKVGDLSKWKNWYPGFENVSLSNEVLAGTKVIKAKADNVMLQVSKATDSLVVIQMKKGARPVINSWKLIRYPNSDSLTLQNYMDFEFKWYPWEKFSSLLLDQSYGPIMEEGLQSLKNN